MYRYHNFLKSISPDFWHTFYENQDLIKVMTYINSCVGAQIGGYPLLENTDIANIANHIPGDTVVWEKLTLTPSQTAGTSTFSHVYSINGTWLSMDRLHDKPTDPEITYTPGVDFLLLSNSLIGFREEPATTTLFVSKGHTAGTRLADDFGTIFGYVRPDSYIYRDTINALLAMLYIGPTIPLIKAVINTTLGFPVAKYGGTETITAINNGRVLTNMYQYNLNGGVPRVNLGDNIGKTKIELDWPDTFVNNYHFTRFEPLVDAITLRTHKTHPLWWTSIPPEMFAKYAEVPLTPYKRDALLNTFLKSYLFHVRINIAKIPSANNFVFHDDIWKIFLDGLPIRSGMLLSTYYSIDWDPIPWTPIDMGALIRPHAVSFWSRSNHPWAPMNYVYAAGTYKPDIYPVVNPEPEFWHIDSNRYHFLEQGNEFDECWSAYPSVMPYVDPTYSNFMYRYVAESANFSPSYAAVDNINANIPTYSRVYTKTASPDLTSTLDSSTLPNTVGSNTHVITISNPLYTDGNYGEAWDFFNTAYVALDGISVKYNKVGIATSNDISVGYIPKTLRVMVDMNRPFGTSIAIQYKHGGAPTWTDLPANGVVRGAFGMLSYRVTLTSTEFERPLLRGIVTSIEL